MKICYNLRNHKNNFFIWKGNIDEKGIKNYKINWKYDIIGYKSENTK